MIASPNSEDKQETISGSKKYLAYGVLAFVVVLLVLTRNNATEPNKTGPKSPPDTAANTKGGLTEAHEDLLRALHKEIKLMRESSERQSEEMKRVTSELEDYRSRTSGSMNQVREQIHQLGEKVETLSELERRKSSSND